jgi:hypothetical protein
LEQEESSNGDLWRDDLLDRKGEARFLIDFLSRRSLQLAEKGQAKSFVLNINAEWGQGKSFFLRRFASQLAQEGHVAVYINAWTDDHAPDPLIALIAALDVALQPFAEKKEAIGNVWEAAKASALGITRTAAMNGGMDAGAPFKECSAQDDPADTEEGSDRREQGGYAKCLLQRFRDTKTSIATFRYSLRRLATALIDDDKKLPVFIIVDELDRCRPAYAIGLLERVKHLFDVTSVVFVVATDTKQLGCSVKAVYGNDFESQRFLMNFFDYTYTFATPDISGFVEFFFESRDIDVKMLAAPAVDPVAFTIQLFRHTGLDLRKIEQCLDLLHTIVTGWNCKCKMQLLYLLPLIVAYETGRKQVFCALSDPFAGRDIVQKTFIKEEWHITFVGSMFEKSEKVEVYDLLERLCIKLRNGLEEATRSCENESQSHHWLRHQFFEEVQQVHHGHYHNDSIMKKYHRLVQQAGRLTTM